MLSALKKEHPVLENKKFLDFFMFLWFFFALLDPDPLTGFRIRIQSGSGTLISLGFLSIYCCRTPLHCYTKALFIVLTAVAQR
jgi:hypothetical protein